MSLCLKPYPQYKDSGLPWLGKTPAHWQTRRLKYLLREINKRSTNGQEQLLRVSQYTGVTTRGSHEKDGAPDTRALSLSGYKRVASQDLVINIMLAWNGSLGVSNFDGIVSPAYCVYRFTENANPWFFHHLLRLPLYKGRIKGESTGVVESRLRLYTDHLFRIEALLPPVTEQLIIARFSDAFSRRIDRLIRVKQRLIKLLNEQKQAIINRAVTRGLDPDVRLKPSGVDWLGDVPARWEVSRVKREFMCLNHLRIPLSGMQRGAMAKRMYDYYGASGVIDKVNDYIFDDDLLLIAEDGANLVLRNLPLAIIARGKFWVNNHAHILKPKGGNLEYLANLMEVVNYRPWISGAAQPKLTKDHVMSIPLVVPPVSEQRLIVDQLDNQTAPLRSTIERARREIELLREYRTRLVADVVTGKLDVRSVELSATGAEETEAFDEDDNIEAPEDANAIEELA